MNSPNSNNLTPPPSGPVVNMESRIDRAIEQKPEIQIPADFAMRVTARAVTQTLRRRRFKPQFGPMIALLSAPVAAFALFALAPHTSPNLKSLGFDAELILLTELAFIGWWITRTYGARMTR